LSWNIKDLLLIVEPGVEPSAPELVPGAAGFGGAGLAGRRHQP